jgi:MYXO-CTERM domain-containing protein
MKIEFGRCAGVFAAAAALVLGIGGEALAQVTVTQAYCIPAGSGKQGGFTAMDDVNAGGTLALNGNAAIIDEPANMMFNGALRLTQATNGQNAQVYYLDPLDFSYVGGVNGATRPLRVYFSFSIGPNLTGAAGLTAGAGLAFLAQNAANEQFQTGANGAGMGYGGIGTSFAVEFDTFRDIPPGGANPTSDPIGGDHVGFVTDGTTNFHEGLSSPGFLFGGPTYERSHVWIDYPGNGSKVLAVYLSNQKVKPAAPIMFTETPDPMEPQSVPSNFDTKYWMEIMASMTPPQGWIGFTAANYSNRANAHYIHEWEFSNTGDIPCRCTGADACKGAMGIQACSAGPMTQNKGICVECTTADTTHCPAAKPLCHTTKEECVECNANTDCGFFNPVCSQATNTCGPCAMDTDCSGFPMTPVCAMAGGTTGQCVECDDDTDCGGETPRCDLATNMCVECLTGTDCTAEEPVCDPGAHTCGPCTTNADCAMYPQNPACAVIGVNAGECVECTQSGDCMASEPVCDILANTCNPCMTDADCLGTPETPLCATSGPNTGACVECKDDGDCPAEEPLCNTQTNTCGKCTTDADCAGTPETPACATMGTNAGNCVECTTNAHCPMEEPVCDATTNTCGKCATDADCPADNPVCDPTSKTCGPCTSNEDCEGTPETPVCAMSGTMAGTCVECESSMDCAAPTPICDTPNYDCVECVTNADCPMDKPACNTSTDTCVPVCKTDADCEGTPETPVCATTGPNQGICVPCNVDRDCQPEKPSCDEATNTCNGCTEDADCGAQAPVCNVVAGTCGPCSVTPQCARFPETPLCQTSGAAAGQCVSTDVNDVIAGGGCDCEAAGSASNEGTLAGLMSVLGLAAAVTRRRRRVGARAD